MTNFIKSPELCNSCRSPKANMHCELCQEAMCKSCSQFIEASTFSFQSQTPAELKHSRYCYPCYDLHVLPALEQYGELMEKARGVYFFFNTRRKPIPMIRKSKVKVEVKACSDRDETILRLGFLAAEQGFNAVMDSEVLADKIRNEGYQTSVWRGTGILAQVDAEKLERSVAGRLIFE